MRTGFASLIAFCAMAVGVAMAMDIDRLRSAYQKIRGEAPQERFLAWTALLTKAGGEAEKARLARVNDFFNWRIRFSDDQEAWGQSDYWATPMETLASGNGDCEDFAIAKYYSLLQAGVPVEKLRLVYVRARTGGSGSSLVQAHMVLAYYPGPEAEPLILDNLLGSIQPASKRSDLQPVFSFNGRHIYQSSAQSGGATTSTTRLSRWQDLLLRARQEGFDP